MENNYYSEKEAKDIIHNYIRESAEILEKELKNNIKHLKIKKIFS